MKIFIILSLYIFVGTLTYGNDIDEICSFKNNANGIKVNINEFNRVFSFISSWYKQEQKFVGAVSSVGRASRLHREGHRFESFTAHHLWGCSSVG